MPRLVKGAKWAFALVVVGPGRELPIPADAWREFGFLAGEQALFMPGSRRSGGFALSTPALQAQAAERLDGGALSVLARARFRERQVILPPEINVAPGDLLLAVRGSRYGLGFVAKGPIHQEALRQRDRLPCETITARP